jgi:hypothetical protein
MNTVARDIAAKAVRLTPATAAACAASLPAHHLLPLLPYPGSGSAGSALTGRDG